MSKLTSVIVIVAATSLMAAPAPLNQEPAPDPGSSARSSSWREIVARDFIVTGNAPTGELRRTLVELTRFRDSLAQLFPGAVVTSPVRTYVVVLRDFDAFQRFQPRDSRGKVQQNVGGYFSRGADANVIVLPASRGDNSLQTIFHEYTHYFVSRNVRTSIPTWLNEGLADFYSTFRGDYRGKTLVGSIPASRMITLRNSTFVPLRDIVAPRDLESMWRWEKQIGMFYAESWALVHYIIVGRQHPVANPLGTYLASFRKSGSHDTAFREAFGTDVDGMDKELRQYVRRVSLNARVYDLQTDKQGADEARPISEADMNALEGRLLLQAGAWDEAERELTGVVKQQPGHAAGQISLARLRLEQDREDEAIASLQQVVEANPGDGAALYYLGAALEHAWRHEEALAAYSKAIKLMPGNPSPWSGLSSAALGLRRDSQAAAALQNALDVEWSPSYYYTQGLQALRLGRDDLASASIATYLELRGTGEDQSVYPLFVRALAAWRAGRPADAEAALAIAEKAEPPQEWTRTVLRYLQGRLEEAQLMRAAGDIGEQTEAHTYIAFKNAMAGREDEAVAHFRWVAERGAKNYLEYGLARNELNRLKYRNRPATVLK
ncbi:MAG TPA: tetratricopeptide repeat protein [Vicinamibacterales bacterium]|jgi:tetratricopeptide (TPR) repeat protein|nr:tetratricopeptide repeat protein [Vicinamibacterales bacterium]